MNIVRKVLDSLRPYKIRTKAAATIQYLNLRTSDARSAQKLILFLIPGHEFLSGGILSIFSLYRLSTEMDTIHDSRVLMCFFPGEAGPAYRYHKFKNDVLVYPFEMVLNSCQEALEILMHIPAYALEHIVTQIGVEGLLDLRRRKNLRINILNQNILVMPDASVVHALKEIIPDLTCTTAHPSYSTSEQRQLWGIPIHHLPAWFYPDDAPHQPFETKRDLMLVSPDPNPNREGIIGQVTTAFPDLEICIIKDIPFDKYLKLEETAKWSLTFGEGMDAYFLGVILRGGVGFAVYNNEFFTPEYRDSQTVYSTFSEMQSQITSDIQLLNSKSAMESYNSQIRPLIAAKWGPEKTRVALESFYRRQYTHP